MGKKMILRAVAVGALLVPQAARAQDGDGGVVLTFGIEERLTAGRNLALEVPAEGRTTVLDTVLSFGVTSVTPLSRLSVAGGATLRIGEEPTGSVSEFQRPRLSFVYSREVADAVIEVTGDYSRDPVEFLRTLPVGELPEDADDLEGEGLRTDYSLDGRVEFGRTAPFGMVLEAGLSGVDYEDTTSASLDDIRRHRLGAAARFSFSPLSEGVLSLDREVSVEDDTPVETETTTDALEFALRQDVSARSRFVAALGYSRVQEVGLATREESGLTGRFGYEWDMPDGMIDALLETGVDDDGRRSTLSFGRSRDLPLGNLTARLGVTRGDGQDAALIGNLALTRELPTGSLAARLDHAVDSTDAGESRTTTLALDWDHDITEVSGVALGVSYSEVRETGENDISRATLSASYSHSLTEDWAMNVGLAWRMRDEDTVGRATSEEVFLSLSRDLTWRR